MKIGGAGVGYTSGAMYKRHRNLNYASGTQFKRYGEFGLWQPRNRSAMNRAAADGYNSAFASVGYVAFDATLVQSQGLSEISVNQLAKRVKEAMNALVESSANLSLASKGTDGAESAADDEDDSVDETV